RGSALTIADFASGKPPRAIMTTPGGNQQLRWCKWVTDARLACSVYYIDSHTGTDLVFTRLVALNADGSDMKMLSNRTSERSLGYNQYGGSIIDWTGDGKGAVLMMSQATPERDIGTKLASSK